MCEEAKRGKSVAEIFWGNKWNEIPICSDNIECLKLIWQCIDNGPHEVFIFTTIATETQFSGFENTQNLFPNSITQTQVFEFWVMETNVKNQAKHIFIRGTHAFWKLGDENWVISFNFLMIQTDSKYSSFLICLCKTSIYF